MCGHCYLHWVEVITPAATPGFVVVKSTDGLGNLGYVFDPNGRLSDELGKTVQIRALGSHSPEVLKIVR